MATVSGQRYGVMNGVRTGTVRVGGKVKGEGT